MNWREVAILVAALGFFSGGGLFADDGGKRDGGGRHGCCQHASRKKDPRSAAPACALCQARDARSAEIAALRAEIAKARAELASLRKPSAERPAAESPADRWLGLQVAEGRYGRLEITGVVDGSPAAAAGIRKGDTLLLWGNRGVLCAKDLQDLAAQVKAGEKAELTVLREHTWIKAEAVRPAEAVAPAQPAQPAEQPAEQPAGGQAEEPPPTEQAK